MCLVRFGQEMRPVIQCRGKNANLCPKKWTLVGTQSLLYWNTQLSHQLRFPVVPVIDCAGTQQLYYYEPQPSTVKRLANTFTCSVKKTTSCRTVSRPDCKQITWNECSEVPIPKCSFQKIFIPTQKFKHRKKCLFTNSKKNSRPSYEKAVFRDVEVDELEFDYELDNA